MDWRSVNFDWNRARAFLVTAEEGSLSAAARALGMTQPTLGRQVAALQEELGVALFERGGRGLELTPGGLELVEHVRAMGDAASRLSLAATGRSESIEGTVCVSATVVTAVFALPAIVRRLRAKHPGIRIEIVATDTSSDLRRREADIAIRAYRPTQADLIARKLREVPAYLYAARAYLYELGMPRTADDLQRAAFIAFEDNAEYVKGLNAFGLRLGPGNFPLMTANHLVHWELVKQGAAIGIIPAEMGDAEPGLVRVLPGQIRIDTELWLVSHRELKTSRRVRTVYDFLAGELSGRPAPGQEGRGRAR